MKRWMIIYDGRLFDIRDSSEDAADVLNTFLDGTKENFLSSLVAYDMKGAELRHDSFNTKAEWDNWCVDDGANPVYVLESGGHWFQTAASGETINIVTVDDDRTIKPVVIANGPLTGVSGRMMSSWLDEDIRYYAVRVNEGVYTVVTNGEFDWTDEE